MHIKFIANDTPSQAVNATVEVDSEGDLTLRLNGVKVLYLDNVEGIVSRFTMTPDDAQHLRRAGFDVDGGRLKFNG